MQNKNASRPIVFFMLLLLSGTMHGQGTGPPSLTVGAGEVLLKKGMLDAELIASIVSNKQDEVKKEFARRVILEKLVDGNYAVWNFVRQNLDAVFDEQNPEIIKKELMRNTLELMTVVGIIEFYFDNHTKDTTYTGIIQDILKEFDSVNGINEQSVAANSSRDDKLPKLGVQEGSFFPQPVHLFKLKKKYAGLKVEPTGRMLYLHNILVDLSFSVCSENQYLQQLGLFQSHREAPEQKLLDNYSLLINAEGSMYDSLKKKLKDFKMYFTQDIEFLARNSYRISMLTGEELKDTTTVPEFDRKSFQPMIDFPVARLQEIFTDLKNSGDQRVNADVLLRLNKLLRHDLVNNYRDDDNILYDLENEIIPKLVELNVTTDLQLSEMIDYVDHLAEAIKQRSLLLLLQDERRLESRRKKSYILYWKDFDRIANTYVRFLSLLDNLDKAGSYESAFKYINDLGNLFTDKLSAILANKILNANDRYLMVNRDSNRVEIDVESLYQYFYHSFALRNARKVSPYFSVGVNYAYRWGSDSLAEGASKSFVYAGEKIGVKIKLRDWYRRRTFLTYKFKENASRQNVKKMLQATRPPLVDDLHAVVFGSGILYQLQELNSDKSFNSPYWGVGMGVSFFNNMDFNFNVGFPFERNSGPSSFFNFSFDIKIGEYLSELAKKRRMKKIEKD